MSQFTQKTGAMVNGDGMAMVLFYSIRPLDPSVDFVLWLLRRRVMQDFGTSTSGKFEELWMVFLEQREEREDPVAKHSDTTLLAIHTFTSFESKICREG